MFKFCLYRQIALKVLANIKKLLSVVLWYL